MKRRTRIIALAAALLMPSMGLTAWYAVSKASGNDDGLAPILKNLGFSELTPPSRFFGPGTFITVETLLNGSVRLHLACKMDQDALAASWRESATLDTSRLTNVAHTFGSSAEALKAATARATGKTVKGVNVSLKDMRILTMSHESLINLRQKYLKGACEEAVVWNLEAGSSVCQTEEVLQADVVYRIETDEQLGSTGKLELAAQAAGSADIKLHVSDVNEVRGDGLYLGVRYSLRHCFRLAENGQHSTLVSL